MKGDALTMELEEAIMSLTVEEHKLLLRILAERELIKGADNDLPGANSAEANEEQPRRGRCYCLQTGELPIY